MQKLSTAYSRRQRSEPALAPQPEGFPSGHFYSPYPLIADIVPNEELIFDISADHVSGVDLADASQVRMLEIFAEFYTELPFQDAKSEPYRYFFDNPAYSYADGIILYSMLRWLRPARLIEIGSGYSSALTLDVNEFFLNGAIQCIFIEPYVDLLMSLMKPEDREATCVIPSRL